jgi:hypothetical protein
MQCARPTWSWCRLRGPCRCCPPTQGWSAATLTPNHNEFLRLAEAVGVKVDEKDPTALLPEVVT